MFRRTIPKQIGDKIRSKMVEYLSARGNEIARQDDLREFIEAFRSAITGQVAAEYALQAIISSYMNGIPLKLLSLSGHLSGNELFDQIMRPLNVDAGLTYTTAKWVVKCWIEALGDRLQSTGLTFDEPGQDRPAYLLLRKPHMPRLEKIESIVKTKFHVTLAPTKVMLRAGGYRALREGWSLAYSFGRDKDGREYLDWNHGHSMTNTAYGRIYEDGEEVTLGSSNG